MLRSQQAGMHAGMQAAVSRWCSGGWLQLAPHARQ